MRTTTRSSASTRTWPRSPNRRGKRRMCWGTPTAASARSRPRCSPTGSGSWFCTSRRWASSRPPHVVDRLEELHGEKQRDELVAYFMQEVAGLPPDQIELLRSLPAWEARLAAAHTIPREELANREYAFDPDRFRGLDVPTLFLLGGDSPAPFQAGRRGGGHGAAGLPGRRHAGAAACRHGYRHRALHTRGAELSRSGLTVIRLRSCGRTTPSPATCAGYRPNTSRASVGLWISRVR